MKKMIKAGAYCLLLVCIVVGYSYFFGTARVNGSSMFPNYKDGDFLFISKLKEPEYGDVVAVNSTELGKFLCKRVIGVGGDHIVINSNGLYRNDELLKEVYLEDSSWLDSTVEVDLIVPDSMIFVLGDNRNNSTDSRELGCLGVDEVFGVSVFNFTASLGISREFIVALTTVAWILVILSLLISRKNWRKL